MAVGVIAGTQTEVFRYGVSSTTTGEPVSAGTLFEIGSISKTFTATLATWAQDEGRLSLAGKVSEYLPSLRDSKFGEVSLLNLGTHTPGGVPLQVPDDIHNNEELLHYFSHWQPKYAPSTYRTYANPSIGMLGVITAKAMGEDFTALAQRLFLMLGMKNTFIDVPATSMGDYAQGYTKDDKPVRMSPGVLWAEAYGVRSTASDMLRYLSANMKLIALDRNIQNAILETHTGYFKAGVMTQDLIWEQYSYPVTLKTLLEGNSPAMIFDATAVTGIAPPEKPRADVWINKTGSTNGFGAYVAFIPEKRLGIVLLANKSYAIEDRVSAAYEILSSLGGVRR